MSPLPALSFPAALRGIAGASQLAALDGGPGGESWLSWGDHLEPLPWRHGLDLAGGLDAWAPRGREAARAGGDAAAAADAHAAVAVAAEAEAPATGDADELPLTDGWCGFPGGVLVQLDYEAPAAPPRAWRPRAWASWTRGMGPVLGGEPAHQERMRAALARVAALPARSCPAPCLRAPPTPTLDRASHARAVREIQARIGRGDLYQANLTLAQVGVLAPGEDRDVGTFLRLRELSPAPYAGLFRSPSAPSVVSHSPECFLRARGAAVRSSPIKGTRGRVAGRESERRAELLASAKDRAELAMIIDLVRHDLGRVAVPGSVQVERAARVLDLDYAHHLVGDVRARLRPGQGYGPLIASAFPAGSITGAPKRMAMQVISDLERGRRGAYCGAFGWIAAQGCDLAVAIRTLEIEGDEVRLHAGGGIVADSDPDAEWEELCIKSQRMLACLSQDQSREVAG